MDLSETLSVDLYKAGDIIDERYKVISILGSGISRCVSGCALSHLVALAFSSIVYELLTVGEFFPPNKTSRPSILCAVLYALG